MEGEVYYKAAVALTDKYPGTQFSEMLSHDSLVGPVERMYFRNEWRDLTPYGYNTFCLKMEESGQKRWLLKIKELDETIMLKYLEQQLMQASRDGKSPNRAMLEAAVKALQGVSALSKINSEADRVAALPLIEVRFSGVDVNPITGEVYPGTEKTNDIDSISAPTKSADEEGGK